VLVENRPGANGNLGAEALLRSPADGLTVLVTPPGPLAINGALYPDLGFDPRTAFAPVSMMAVAPLVLVVNPALSVQGVRDLIELARNRPGKLSAASQGNGSTGHLALELFKSVAGVDIAHVPYKGSAPAITDLIADHVQMMFDNTTTSLPQVRQGRLRALGVAELHRLPSDPAIPTIDESGLKGFEATPWFGMVARAGTPSTRVEQLAEAVRAAIEKPELNQRFAALGVELRAMAPAAFGRFIAAETTKWERVIRVSGARAD
jgi:tripartite-type tricarboxylate transporter receptor subunit TctC